MNFLSTILACSVCMGGADSKVAPAINAAIFSLLGCIGLMLSFIGCVGYSFVRRARTISAQSAEDFSDHE